MPISNKLDSLSDSSSSTLLSPFILLSNIRSSTSLLDSSNNQIINSKLNKSKYFLDKSELVSRSTQLNFDKSLEVENKNEMTKKPSQLATPISTNFNDFQNKAIQSCSAVSLKDEDNDNDKDKDVYKSSSDSLLKNKALASPSSLSFKTKQSNRKRPICNVHLNKNIKNEKFDNKMNVETIAKRICLSNERQIYTNNELDDDIGIVFDDEFISSKTNKKVESSNILNFGNKFEIKNAPKSQQSRGIWNFVSSVISKYLS